MSNYDHILNNINKSSIDLSTSNKYDEIIELYKMIVVKLIISCESTLYKICSTNILMNNYSTIIFLHGTPILFIFPNFVRIQGQNGQSSLILDFFLL